MTNHDRIAQNPHHRSFPEKTFTPKFSRENYLKKKKKKKKKRKKKTFISRHEKATNLLDISIHMKRPSKKSKKKKSHHFPTKKLSRKTISKETNKYETRKRNRKTVEHGYTSSSSRSTSGDGKKLSVNFLERERGVLEREAEARE